MMRLHIAASLAWTLLTVDSPGNVNATGATLTERVTESVRVHRPSWKILEALKERMPWTIEAASSEWETDGHLLELGLHAYRSIPEASEDLQHMWDVDDGGKPPAATSHRRHYRRENVVVWIQVVPRLNGPFPAGWQTKASSLADELAEIVDEQITGVVTVDECTNELHPPVQPPPASAKEAFVRDVVAGCAPRVRVALKSGADPNARDNQRTPVLAIAVQRADRSMVRLLLDAGANPNAVLGAVGTVTFRVFDGPSSYRAKDRQKIFATQLGILDDLLGAGADIEARDQNNARTLLLVTVTRSSDDGPLTPFIEALLARGARIETKDRDGRTALMLALDHTNAKWTRNTVEFLLANGVDLNARDATGKTALTYARESLARFANAEFRPVVELLLQAGASD